MILCDECGEPIFRFSKPRGYYVPCRCGLEDIVSRLLALISCFDFHAPSDCRYCPIDCGYWKYMLMQGASADSAHKRPTICKFGLIVIGGEPGINAHQAQVVSTHQVPKEDNS